MAVIYKEDIPTSMKAAVVEKFQAPLQMKTLPIPELQNGQALIKIDMTGLCHSDVHVIDGDWSVQPPLPIVPGHEGIGTVIKTMGNNSKGVKVGDRVCTPWLHKSCMACGLCKDGWETLCENQLMTGFLVNGSFSNYMVADASFVGKVPEKLPSSQAAPISCAGVTAYKALKVLNASPGTWVAVVGAGGGLGHLCVQYAKLNHLKIIGVDAGKNEFMKKIGCDAVVDISVDNVPEKIKQIVPEGLKGAISFVPNPSAAKLAASYLGRQGTLVLVGIPGSKLEFEPLDIIMKSLKITGSIVGTPKDLKEALEIAAEGNVRSEVEVVDFSNVNKHVEALKTGKIQGRLVMTM